MRAYLNGFNKMHSNFVNPFIWCRTYYKEDQKKILNIFAIISVPNLSDAAQQFYVQTIESFVYVFKKLARAHI